MSMKNLLVLSVLGGLCLAAQPPAWSAGAVVVTDSCFWADGVSYRTVGTPASLPDAPPETFDHLYLVSQRFGSCGRNDATHFTLDIADAAPGVSGHNGGRWQVSIVSFGEQCENYQRALDLCAGGCDLSSYTQLACAVQAGLATIHPPFLQFECPILRDREQANACE